MPTTRAGLSAPHIVAPRVATEGRVEIPKGLALINKSGYAARGTLFERDLLDGRVNLTLGETGSAEDTRLGSVAGPFAQAGSRRALNVSGNFFDTPDMTLTLAGSALDTRFALTGRRGPDDVVGARENTSFGGGVRLGLWRDRVRWSSEAAWSRLEETKSSASNARRGVAHSQRLEADVIDSGDVRLSGHGAYQRVDADYVALKGDASADRVAAGFGGKLTYGAATLKIMRRDAHDNLDNVPGAPTTRELTHSGRLKIALAPGGETGAVDGRPGLASVLPDAIKLSVAETRIDRRHGAQAESRIGDKTEQAIELGLAWDWQVGTTAIGIERRLLHSPGTAGDAAGEDNFLKFAQTFDSGAWSTRFGLDVMGSDYGDADARELERRFTTRVEIGATAVEIPDFTAALALDHKRKRHVTDGDSDIVTTWKFRTAVDFGKFLPAAAAGYQPYLKLTFEARGNEPGKARADGSPLVDYTFGVGGGIRF